MSRAGLGNREEGIGRRNGRNGEGGVEGGRHENRTGLTKASSVLKEEGKR